MRVILQENLANLGKVGDVVTVKSGYARNYLVPKDKAVIANEQNTKIFEARRAELEKTAAQLISVAKQRAEKLENLAVSVEVLASEEGKLYGSIGPREVAEAIQAMGVDVKKSEISLPEGPIRHLGEYRVHVILHSQVTADVVFTVAPEKAQQ